MSEKIYLVLTNYPGSGRSEPYSCFAFRSLADAEKCPEVNEHSVAFSTAQQLADTLTMRELEGMIQTLEPNLAVRRGSIHSPLEAAKAVYMALLKIAKPYRKPDNMTDEANTQTDEALAKDLKSELENAPGKKGKKAKAPKEPKPKKEKKESPVGKVKYNPDAAIIRTDKECNLRPGTFRHRNQEIVFASKTVGEAVEKLKALESSPSGYADIKLALEQGWIEVR
jgi:hypothetical protein